MNRKNPPLHLLGLFSLTTLTAGSLQAKSPSSISLAPLGSVAAGSFLTSAAEIVAYDAGSKRLLVVNAQAAQIDVVDIADPAAPVHNPHADDVFAAIEVVVVERKTGTDERQ